MTSEPEARGVTRLRSFVLASCLAISVAVGGAIYTLVYFGAVQISSNLIEDASEEVASATFSCMVALMEQAEERGHIRALWDQYCNRDFAVGSLRDRHHDLVVHYVGPRDDAKGLHATAAAATDSVVALAAKSGRRVSHRNGDFLRSFFPIRASEQCLACHQAAHVGGLLALAEVRHDMGQELAAGRSRVLSLLTWLIPFPFVGAFLATSVLTRRVHRSIIDVERGLEGIDQPGRGNRAAPVKVDIGFAEFNGLYRLLVEKLNRATRELRLDVDVLGALIPSPGAARDWKKEVARIVVDLQEILPVHAVCLIFEDGHDAVAVDFFWAAAAPPSLQSDAEDRVREILSAGPHEQLVAKMRSEHTNALPGGARLEIDSDSASRRLEVEIRETVGVGGAIGVGILPAAADQVGSVTIGNLFSGLFAIGGTLKELSKYTAELEERATRDALTGLYNHRMFWEIYSGAISRAERLQESVSVLVVGLDGFKSLNGAYGHNFGDTFLRAAAETLAGAVRENEVIARRGGDEFVISMDGTDLEQAYALARRVVEAFRSFRTPAPDRTQLGVTVSIGVAVYPHHGRDAKQVLDVADDQMYKAKAGGRNQISLPSGDDIARVSGQSTEKSALIRRAIDDDLVVPYFQPIVDLASGEIEAHEVLMRIALPERVVAADEVVDLAEEMGLITTMDLMVIDKALAACREQRYEGRLFVNLSPKALVYGEFMESVLDMVNKYEVDPSTIVFELTERETVRNLSLLTRFIEDLKTRGFGFAIDDFGAGFSSFQYLRRFPVEFVKIDGEFVRTLADPDSTDMAFVTAIGTLARGLGIKCLAEFVEDGDVLNALVEADVGFAQGYHIGRPSPELVHTWPVSEAASGAA